MSWNGGGLQLDGKVGQPHARPNIESWAAPGTYLTYPAFSWGKQPREDENRVHLHIRKVVKTGRWRPRLARRGVNGLQNTRVFTFLRNRLVDAGVWGGKVRR